MRDVEIQMNWRHVRRAFVVLLALLFILGGVLLARRGFDWFLALHLVLGAVVVSLVLAAAGSGVYAVVQKWGRKELHPSDFLLPLLFLVGAGIWTAFAFWAPVLAFVLEVGFWLVAGSILVVGAVRRPRGTDTG